MNQELSPDRRRLLVLGQISVLRDCLDKLEASLMRYPLGAEYLSEETTDAIGNVSLQTGTLMGVISLLDALGS